MTRIYDELGNRYVVHPDTKKPTVGFSIPQWEMAVDLSLKLSPVVPGSVYIGWDLALTDKGWVMVEGNSRGRFICFHMVIQNGFRKELEGLLGCKPREFCRK